MNIFWFSVTLLILQTDRGNSVLTSGRSLARDGLLELDLTDDQISKKGLPYFNVNFNNETQLRGIRQPCECADGQCGCCSGNLLQNFNINIRQHFCINMTYEPEDLSLGVKMSFNDLVLLTRSVSGKTPPPLCIPIPRVSTIKFCGRFTNVYFIGRNIHACLTIETEWNDRTVFSYNFDCFRLGVNGVAIISAEAGGGLPHPPDQEPDNIEEYDELLENQTTKRPNRYNSTRPIKPPKNNSTRPIKPIKGNSTRPIKPVKNNSTRPVKRIKYYSTTL